ncbi:hypothetical protein QBC39DRAFT_313063 [Podospora conica]|nr:hypothetical protein QBC39DRAFT_313063 [Schizothecium conicum]
MRDLGYVCLRCRVGQLIACDSRRIRRPGRAASFSTTTTTAATVSDEPTHHGHSQARPVTVDQPQPFVKFRRRPETGPGAMNSRSPQHQPSDRSDMLISLFQSVVNSRPQTPRQLPADSPGIMELWQDAHQMRSLLDKRSSAETTWQFFEETMYPRIVNIGGGKAVPRIILRQLYRGFFTQIAEEKAKDFTCSSLPSLELITHRMAELGALWPWTTMMLQLVDTIRRINPSLDAYPSLEDNEAAMARRDTLVRELQLAWRAFNVKGAFKGPPPPKIPDNTQKAFANAFAELYPGYDKGQMYRPMWVALASYGLLTDPKLHFGVKDSAFVVMMQALVETNALPFEEEHRTFAQLCPPHLYAYTKTSNEPESRPVTRRLDVSEFTHEHFISRIHRQIGQAIHKRSIMLMDRAWDEFWGDEAEPSAAQIKKLSEMVELFDYFIIGYTKVRKPNRAIFVWNSMLQAGLKPTIKTWTAMIQGCTKALNPDGIKLVWSRLVASGTKLDTTIWTARISGLIISGDLQAGIDALNEMAAIWKNRDAPQNAALAVQPSIEPVNAALAWLLRLDRTSTAETLLQWAARQGIQPDIFTFNTLLRPLVRTGNTAEMNQLFDAMAQAGVRADVVTYTILLDGALADVGTMTPDEQTAAVTRVIGDMERAGVEANMMAYAKIIYNILQNGNTNAAAAVRAVISHIWGRGLELTSHIYTMLAEHYFSRDPPDAAAVTHLIASRRLAANPNIDRVFWERVIKGYCQAGDVGRAVRIFEHASGMGSTITFSTLYEFLSALAENEMMDEARKVVGRAKEMNAAEEPDEQQHGVSGGPGQSRRFWKHRFWHLADAYGLLEEGQLQKFLEGTNWRAGRG